MILRLEMVDAPPKGCVDRDREGNCKNSGRSIGSPEQAAFRASEHFALMNTDGGRGAAKTDKNFDKGEGDESSFMDEVMERTFGNPDLEHMRMQHVSDDDFSDVSADSAEHGVCPASDSLPGTTELKS
jgi:hypothetical protein